MKPDNAPHPEKIRHKDLPHSQAWDRAYAGQGRLWRGAQLPLPDLPVQSRILELGCGSGAILPGLTGKVYGIIALDYSFPACRLARAAKKNDEDLELITADARAIPLKDGSADAVVARHVAAHLSESDRTILFNEAARVLRKGGLFIFCDFSKEDFRAGKGEEIEPGTFLRKTGIITHYFTEEEIRKIPGKFALHAIVAHRWSLKVRGRRFPRAEIVATFLRT